MFRVISISLLVAAAVYIAGCKPESKPTEVKGQKDKHAHGDHERGKMMLEDAGPYHAGLTAHLSKNEGNALAVVFETQDKEPKPVALPLTTISARVTRAGDDKAYMLEMEPAPKDERKTDPDGKCSMFEAKAPWMKPEDKLTVVATVKIDGQDKKVTWIDFNPKKFAHVDE